MKIHFHGVRGSIASPGPDTVKYGGNTSCVHIELNNHSNIVLDAGTGIRSLGQKIVGNADDICILLSHRHWDHIQGFPFFIPAYQPDRQIRIYSGAEQGQNDDDLLSILQQMDGATFPLSSDMLPSNISRIGEMDLCQQYELRGVKVTTKELNHPGGGRAFRIEEDGVSVAYVTDNELDPPGVQATTYDEWVDFCHGVDLLIHDAQYTEDDMPHKHGWGHSLISQVRQLSYDAEVRHLVMFHHDPERTDFQLEEIERENDIWLKSRRHPARCIVSFEGLSLEVKASTSDPDHHTLDVL